MRCTNTRTLYTYQGWKANRPKTVRSLKPPNKTIKGPIEETPVPCRQCMACRINHKTGWAHRIWAEASGHTENAFVTLTYAPEYLNPYRSLDKTDVQLFIMRLRKHFNESEIRYYLCGEYGRACKNCHLSERLCLKHGCGRYQETLGRPHYHIILFGLQFPDYYYDHRRKALRSDTLEKLWPLGRCETGTVTPASSAYCAGYMTKKLTGVNALKHYLRTEPTGEKWHITPEFTTMSRRPGIASDWIKANATEVYSRDKINWGRYALQPIQYYDAQFDIIDHEALQAIKSERKARGRHRQTAESKAEAYQRELILKQYDANLQRRMDNESLHIPTTAPNDKRTTCDPGSGTPAPAI